MTIYAVIVIVDVNVTSPRGGRRSRLCRAGLPRRRSGAEARRAGNLLFWGFGYDYTKHNFKKTVFLFVSLLFSCVKQRFVCFKQLDFHPSGKILFQKSRFSF